ncbi:MAG: methionine biosynthesis protein MetW [Candidatus Gracilibacteria bacterium]|nr:methionine biosynthesis protein MetW [Candidatus Gracilibacteria bacterium]MDD3120331.1 methionine biosynthesis protein MetW [Candidatus Gracilibacteria bacterium]MDD4530009.1 methionine biosynthesis protein MetW [Candidatus Gracilibacteria bacterium]
MLKLVIGVFLLAFLFIMIGTYGFYLISGIISAFRTKGVPYVPSPNCYLKIIKQNVKLDKGKKIVDLGCGDGKALRFFEKEFGLIGDGYDLNHFSILFGKLLNSLFKSKNVNLSLDNFFNIDLKKYDYIYVYLLSETLASIEDWIFENMKDDAVIISSVFKFAKHEPSEIYKDHKGKTITLIYKK